MVSPPTTGTSRRHPPAQPLQRLFRAIGRRLTQSWNTLFAHFGLIPPDEGADDHCLTATDKRQHPRIQLADTTVHVTDGCLAAIALIDNISPDGICLCNLPEQLYRNTGQLTVFSSDNPGMPILHIEPRWQNNNWSGKTIGAAILNVSDTWRLFFVHAAEQLEA